MLSSSRRSLIQGVWRRGLATHQQGWAGSYHQGRRPSPVPPAPPPTPPEKIEWWAVDGELFKAEKFDPKRILAPLGNEHIPNRKRRKDRIKHLDQTRLKLRVHGQESYWAAYMKRFQAMRDEWERHVWDPLPVPVPKPRNPAWVAEESEKYVWKDPRRDAYTFNVSRMDHSASRSRFDNKIGYKVQGMNHYPRDPGGSSVRPGITPMRRDSYKDSRSNESAYKDERYGHQRSTDIGRRNSRQFEYDNFEDVFDDRNTTRSGENVTRSSGNATENRAQSARHRQQASLSTEDDEDGVEFNWDESDSEEADGDGDDNDADDEDEDVSQSRAQRDRSQSPQKRGWYGNEDDLFKDDD